MDTNDNTPNQNSAEEKEISVEERALFEQHIVPIKYPAAPSEKGQGTNHVVFSHWYRTYASSTNKVRSELRKNCQATGFATVPSGGQIQMHTNGTVFDGYFESNQFIEGRMIDARGNFFEGKFNKQQIIGLGFMKLENQMTYDGEFHNGKIQGKGILTWISEDNSVLSFTGLFDNSRYFSGKCEIQFCDQTVKTIEGVFNVPFIPFLHDLVNTFNNQLAHTNQVEPIQFIEPFQNDLIVRENQISTIQAQQRLQTSSAKNSKQTEILTSSTQYVSQKCSDCQKELKQVSQKIPPMLPQEYYGLIIINQKYEKTPNGYKDIIFADQEQSRIESLFKKFCTQVQVLRDGNCSAIDDQLDRMIEKIIEVNRKQRQQVDQEKKGLFIFVHYLGHGATYNQSTHIIINAPESKDDQSQNPYPLERKLRNITINHNCFILASINCCREIYKKESQETLGPNQKSVNKQFFMVFSATNYDYADATEKFGIDYVNQIKSNTIDGILKLPKALALFNVGEKNISMAKPVHLKTLPLRQDEEAQEVEKQLNAAKADLNKLMEDAIKKKIAKLSLEAEEKIQTGLNEPQNDQIAQQELAEETQKQKLEQEADMARIAQQNDDQLKFAMHAKQKLIQSLKESLNQKKQQKQFAQEAEIISEHKAEKERLAREAETQRRKEAENQRLLQEIEKKKKEQELCQNLDVSQRKAMDEWVDQFRQGLSLEFHCLMIKFLQENWSLFDIPHEFLEFPPFNFDFVPAKYLAGPNNYEIIAVKEVLDILYDDDFGDGESLLNKYKFLQDFVKQQFELRVIQGKEYQLPPHISALNDTFADCTNRYKFKVDGIYNLFHVFIRYGMISRNF